MITDHTSSLVWGCLAGEGFFTSAKNVFLLLKADLAAPVAGDYDKSYHD
jgi:hypothetical protein